MSQSLTWAVLPAAETHKCCAVDEPAAVRDALFDADRSTGGKLLDAENRSTEQVRILTDMYFHILRFAKDREMTPEKVSTLVGIVQKLHQQSVTKKLSSAESFKVLEALLLAHGVHRPPYSAAIFSIDDLKAINENLLTTYYRHYKLYQYVFTKMDLGHVKMDFVGLRNQIPPASLPPMIKAVPLAQWEAARTEADRLEDERQRKLAEERAAIEAEREREAKAQENLAIPSGLKSQLDLIKTIVTRMSADRLEEIEQKLTVLEGRLGESNSKPGGQNKGAAKPPGKK